MTTMKFKMTIKSSVHLILKRIGNSKTGRIIRNSWILRMVGNSTINKERLKKQLHKIDRLNIGCGNNFVDNWLNIGLFPNIKILYGTLTTRNERLVLHLDMTRDFPISPNTINYIYASHFIEHLNFEQGLKFLKNCYKVMKKGGLIRLTFPDLELWNKKYYENSIHFFKKYYNLTKEINCLPELKTKGEIFMSQLHGWEHQWCYDFDSMNDILERVGFSKVTKKKVFDSSIPNIKKLEPLSEIRLLETVCVEAEK